MSDEERSAYEPGWIGEGTGTWDLPVKTLEAALVTLHNKAFTQGAYMRDRDGKVLLDYDEDSDFRWWADGSGKIIRSVSANGAIMIGAVRAGCIFDHMWKDALAGVLLAVARCGVDDLREWADAPKRQKREVRALLTEALGYAREAARRNRR